MISFYAEVLENKTRTINISSKNETKNNKTKNAKKTLFS